MPPLMTALGLLIALVRLRFFWKLLPCERPLMRRLAMDFLLSGPPESGVYASLIDGFAFSCY